MEQKIMVNDGGMFKTDDVVILPADMGGIEGRVVADDPDKLGYVTVEVTVNGKAQVFSMCALDLRTKGSEPVKAHKPLVVSVPPPANVEPVEEPVEGAETPVSPTFADTVLAVIGEYNGAEVHGFDAIGEQLRRACTSVLSGARPTEYAKYREIKYAAGGATFDTRMSAYQYAFRVLASVVVDAGVTDAYTSFHNAAEHITLDAVAVVRVLNPAAYAIYRAGGAGDVKNVRLLLKAFLTATYRMTMAK